jgi:hypothetical protein
MSGIGLMPQPIRTASTFAANDSHVTECAEKTLPNDE